MLKKIENISLLCVLTWRYDKLISSNYPCLEHIFMVPKCLSHCSSTVNIHTVFASQRGYVKNKVDFSTFGQRKHRHIRHIHQVYLSAQNGVVFLTLNYSIQKRPSNPVGLALDITGLNPAGGEFLSTVIEIPMSVFHYHPSPPPNPPPFRLI